MTAINAVLKRYIVGNNNTGSWNDVYLKTDWSLIENKPTNFTPASHNHDSTYLKLSGGTLTGGIVLNNTVALNGKTTNGTTSNIANVNSSNNLSIGSSNFGYIVSNNDIVPSSSLSSGSIGRSTRPWINIYGTNIYENGTSLTSKYLKLTGGTIAKTNEFAPLQIKGATDDTDNSYRSVIAFLAPDETLGGAIGYKSAVGLIYINGEGQEKEVALQGQSASFNETYIALTGTNLDTPLKVKGTSSTQTLIRFDGANNTIYGYLGINSSHVPTLIYSVGNDWYTKTLSLDEHTHSYLPLSGGTLTGALQFNDSYHRISKEDGTTVARTVDSQNPVAVPANSGSKGIAIVAEENPGDYGLLYVGTDGARVVNSGDTGNNFEVYDKDSASIVFRVTQSYGDGIFKGDVYANGANGGDSSKLVTTSTLSNYVQKTIALSSESSLNNALSSGFYRLSDGHVAGFPNSNYSQMIVTRGADTVTQIGLPYSKPDIYIRSGVIGAGDSFSANWKKVTNLGLNTDGYIELNADAKIIAKTTDSNSWDSAVYSSVGYKDNVYISFRPNQTNKYIMVGFTTTPGSSTGESNIAYCWYCTGDGRRYIYNAGYAIDNTGSYSVDDEFVIQYSYGQIKYYYNGTLIKTQNRALGDALYMQVSLYNAGSIHDVTFGNIPSGVAMQNNSFTLGNGEESQFIYRTASGCEAGYYYQTTGDESVVFANEYAHAGWMFANGIKPTQTPGWQQIVTPVVHIKNNCLAINKQIAQGANTPSFALDVNGSGCISNVSTDTPLTIKANGRYGAYIHFKNIYNNADSSMGFIGVFPHSSGNRLSFVTNSTYKYAMLNTDFSVSGTTLTINIPS